MTVRIGNAENHASSTLSGLPIILKGDSLPSPMKAEKEISAETITYLWV